MTEEPEDKPPTPDEVAHLLMLCMALEIEDYADERQQLRVLRVIRTQRDIWAQARNRLLERRRTREKRTGPSPAE